MWMQRYIYIYSDCYPKGALGSPGGLGLTPRRLDRWLGSVPKSYCAN